MQSDGSEFAQRLKAIGEAPDVLSLRQATLDALKFFGVTTVYHVAPITLDARVPRIITMVGLPWTWERQYRARLHLIDPLPRIAKERLSAFIWPDQISIKDLDKKQKRFLELAKKHGAGRGVGVACFGPDSRSGFLGAILAEDAPQPDEEALLRMHSIGQLSMQRYCKLVPSPVEAPLLSNRELEVLHWVAKGKSNSVIAEILQISPSSVDVYLRRIFSKLEVSDRTMAAVKAFSLGMIVSSDYDRMMQEAAKLQESSGEKFD